MIQLCEAAGFDTVFVESVGIGQSETEIAEATDMLMLVIAPGSGDDIQAMKKGIMEVVDLVVVNKADGTLLNSAREAQSHYQQAIRLRHAEEHPTIPRVLLASATTGQGVSDVVAAIDAFREASIRDQSLQRRRARQSEFWMWRAFKSMVVERALADPRLKDAARTSLELIEKNELSIRAAAMRLIEK